jgi:transcriptional regulator of acetoin/glycerol metabolism
MSYQSQQTDHQERPRTLAEIEKQALLTALDKNSGSILKAARELGLARQTMYNKIRKFNL